MESLCCIPENNIAMRSNQSILKGDQSWVFIGKTDAKAETPVLWPPHAKSWLMEKTLMLGGIGGRRRRGWQSMRWLDGITNSMDVSLSELREFVMDREAWHAAIHGVTKSRSDWTELIDVTTSLKQVGFSGGAVVKNPPANAGDAWDMGSISGLGRSLGEGNGNPLQYSCLYILMDRGAW